MNLSALVLLLALSPANAATVQGDIPCGTVPAGAIYTNTDSSFDGRLLIKGVTVEEAKCQVELEPNESIFLVQNR